MDPAETSNLRQVFGSQGIRMGQHEEALKQIMDNLHRLSAGVSQLGSRLDQVSTHLLAAPSSAFAPAPASPPAPNSAPVPPFNHPCEPFIPTPARYSGVLGTCSQFLHQCLLVFYQQPLTYSTDKSKIAFIMSLLSDKASAWALAVSDSNSSLCSSFILFTAEMRNIFDHPIQCKEASSRLLSLSQGSSTVSQYAVDFRILAAECGWDERA